MSPCVGDTIVFPRDSAFDVDFTDPTIVDAAVLNGVVFEVVASRQKGSLSESVFDASRDYRQLAGKGIDFNRVSCDPFCNLYCINSCPEALGEVERLEQAIE